MSNGGEVQVPDGDGYKKTKLGLLPDNWDVVHLDHLFHRIVRKNKINNRNALTISARHGLVNQKDFFNKIVASDTLTGYYLIKRGEFAYNKSYSAGYPVGVIRRLDKYDMGVVSILYICFGLSDVNQCSDYFIQFFDSRLFDDEIGSIAQEGARNHGLLNVPTSAFFKLYIPVPPLPEQKKIASILTSVDDVIEKTEAQISKLQDLKKGMMTELLTKGIGHTEFKDSPVGRIPKSWEVKRIGDLFKERRDSTNNIKTYPLCSLTIEYGLIRKTDRYERSFLLTDIEAENYKVVHPGDIILNPMNLRWGAISKSNEAKPVTVSKYYNILFTKSEITSPSYYESLFQSDLYIQIYDAISTGTLLEKRRVHLSQFVELFVPCPPPEEQQKIADIIKATNGNISEKQQKLSQTKALKKALINDLLTGKKRVITAN